MQILLAIPYAVVAVLSFRRYPAWALWLALWAVVVVTWAPQNPAWGRNVYSPLLFATTVLLAMAALEAFFEHAGTFALTVRLSTHLGLLAIAAGWLFWGYYAMEPSSSAGAAIRQIALCARVGITAFLVLAVAFWLSTGRSRWRTPEFHHLLIVMLVSASFSVGSMLLSRVGWFHWWDADSTIQWVRFGIVTTWLIAVPLRLSRAPSAFPSGGHADPAYSQYA